MLHIPDWNDPGFILSTMSDGVSFPGHLVDQWHPSNPPMDGYRPGSNKRVLWVCSLGHEWEATICDRTRSKSTHCPFCSGARVLPGFNDLATTAPEVAHLWSWANERDITAVSSGSHHKALWDCDVCSYRWRAAIKAVVKLGSRCPRCSGRVTSTGETDLQTLDPETSRAYSSSNPRPVDRMGRWSHEEVLWACTSCQDTWRAAVRETNSPLCRRCRDFEGSLSQRRPDLVRWWSPNNDRHPDATPDGFTRPVLWTCPQGHEWAASPKHFTPECRACRTEQEAKARTARARVRAERRHAREQERCAVERRNDERRRKREARAEAKEAKRAERARRAAERERLEEAKAQASPPARTQPPETGCPQCSNRTSRGEVELREFVESLVGSHNVRSNARGVLDGNRRSELDIYVPEHHLAIEYNGAYWHSEVYGQSRKWEHHDKWRLCREQGISLIAVWSDDWRERRSAIESMVRAKLGLSSSRSVGARTCTVREVASSEAREFFEANHIQGSVRVVSYSYGLVDPGGQTVAVLSVRRSQGDHVITRYATACNVPGGFTRLLTRVKRRAGDEGAQSLVTFSDNSISSGDLYRKAGFTRDADLAPDYSYVYKDTRLHKFNYRLSRFRDDPGLSYDPDMSESQLARLNGLTRAWDYGKTRWRMVQP